MKEITKLRMLALLVTLSANTAVIAAPPSPSTPIAYQFAGYSEAATKGAAGGVVGMHAICQKEFGDSARMCMTSEYWRTVHLGDVGDPEALPYRAWIQPDIVAESITEDGRLYIRDATGRIDSQNIAEVSIRSAHTCNYWVVSDPTQMGWAVSRADGFISLQDCGAENVVTCCVPAVILDK